MSDDDSWIKLEAATRNALAFLRSRTAPAAADLGATAAGALTSGEEKSEGAKTTERKCSAHSSASKQLNAAGALQKQQRI